MKPINLFLTVLVSALIFFGCATTSRFVTPDKLDRVNRIAAVSLLGDKIELKHLGTTVFTNKLAYQNVDWQIDKFAEEIIKKEISDNTKFEYVKLEFGKDKLNETEIKKIYDSETGIPKDNFDFRDFEGYLKRISSQYNIDTLILVTRSRNQIPDTPQYITGYSLYTRSFLAVLKEQPVIFFASKIDVIDLHSMQKIASKVIFDRKVTDTSSIKKEFGELSLQEQKYIEAILKDILKDKLPSGMLELALIPVNYSDGINKTEASVLADVYINDHLPNTCKLTNPFDDGNTWYIELWLCNREQEFPPIIIDKKTGTITWKYNGKKSQ